MQLSVRRVLTSSCLVSWSTIPRFGFLGSFAFLQVPSSPFQVLLLPLGDQPSARINIKKERKKERKRVCEEGGKE